MVRDNNIIIHRRCSVSIRPLVPVSYTVAKGMLVWYLLSPERKEKMVYYL
jgi:hypothetical protein